MINVFKYTNYQLDEYLAIYSGGSVPHYNQGHEMLFVLFYMGETWEHVIMH